MYVCMYVINLGNCCYAGMYERELEFLHEKSWNITQIVVLIFFLTLQTNFVKTH